MFFSLLAGSLTNGRLYNPLSAPEQQYPLESPTPPPLDLKKLIKSQNGEDKKVTEIELLFAPPGPAYEGLKNNVPTSMQELKDHPWPEGTPDWVTSVEKQSYIKSYSMKFDVESKIRFHSSVEKVDKQGAKWVIESASLVKKDTGEWDIVNMADVSQRTIIQ